MVPKGQTSLLMANGQRARDWESGLRRQGFDVTRVEARGSDAARGDFYLCVPDAQRVKAQRYVSDVLADRQRLPHGVHLPGPLMLGAVLIVAALGLLLLGTLLSH